MFSHVCWQSRVGDVQHSFTSAGGRCGGLRGQRGLDASPHPHPGQRRDPGTARSDREEGTGQETEGHTDGQSQRARNKGDRIREGSLSWADARTGPGGRSEQGWLGPGAGTHRGPSRPPAPPTDAGAAEGVPLEARLAVAAVGAGEVVAHLALAAAVHARLTLVHVCRGRPAGHAEARAPPPAGAATPQGPRRRTLRGGGGWMLVGGGGRTLGAEGGRWWGRASPTHLVPSWLAW